MTIAIILLSLMYLLVVAGALDIPEGYEDETGFHYGKEPSRPDDKKG